jgi:hypothetical protein
LSTIIFSIRISVKLLPWALLPVREVILRGSRAPGKGNALNGDEQGSINPELFGILLMPYII